MAKPPIDVTLVRPNVWVVLSEDDPEGGVIIRRFERFSCTCGTADGDCRHVSAARSLIHNAAAVVESISAETTAEPVKRPRMRTAHIGDERVATAKADIVLTPLPPTRKPRPVKVADRAALRIAGKTDEVAA